MQSKLHSTHFANRWLRQILLVIGLLLVCALASTPAYGRERPREVSIEPVADGSVTDVDADGRGDLVHEGYGSVVIGFNSLGPGEQRGVYEFDVSALRNLPRGVRVTLMLNNCGTRYNGTDAQLTLYAAAGNGQIDVGDYGASLFVTEFMADDRGPYEIYDNYIDVTAVTRLLLWRGQRTITFVVRPNPLARETVGAYLYSSLEIADFEQFAAAQLRFSR